MKNVWGVVIAIILLLPEISYAAYWNEVSSSAGVALANTGGDSKGCAWGDYDNDGDPDLFIARYGIADVLYRNNGNGTFTDVTATATIGNTGNGMGAVWLDYNKDGYLDLYVIRYGQSNILWKGAATGVFTDVTTAAGVGDAGNAQSVACADYNGDGYIDIYVGNNGTNVLYRNNKNNTFTDRAASAGVGNTGNSYAVSWADYNNDGWMDIYVVNYLAANALYKNNQNGTFTEVAAAAGVNANLGGQCCAWGDYDRDGDLDLYVGNARANVFYKNNGNGTFTNVTSTYSMDGGAYVSTYAAAWLDYDKDGDLDLILLNRELSTIYRQTGSKADSKKFEAMKYHLLAGGRQRPVSFAWADYNQDGDLDVYVTCQVGFPNRLFKSPGNSSKWNAIKLTGKVVSDNGAVTLTEPSGSGSRVRVRK